MDKGTLKTEKFKKDYEIQESIAPGSSESKTVKLIDENKRCLVSLVIDKNGKINSMFASKEAQESGLALDLAKKYKIKEDSLVFSFTAKNKELAQKEFEADEKKDGDKLLKSNKGTKTWKEVFRKIKEKNKKTKINKDGSVSVSKSTEDKVEEEKQKQRPIDHNKKIEERVSQIKNENKDPDPAFVDMEKRVRERYNLSKGVSSPLKHPHADPADLEYAVEHGTGKDALMAVSNPNANKKTLLLAMKHKFKAVRDKAESHPNRPDENDDNNLEKGVVSKNSNFGTFKVPKLSTKTPSSKQTTDNNKPMPKPNLDTAHDEPADNTINYGEMNKVKKVPEDEAPTLDYSKMKTDDRSLREKAADIKSHEKKKTDIANAGGEKQAGSREHDAEELKRRKSVYAPK